MMVYAYMIAGPTFADPDSFYHVKLTQLMIHERAAITDFPWLAFTSLTESYVDHHFLYHVFLVPWIILFGPISGGKIATIILASTLIALFYTLLRSYRVPGAFFFALLLLCNPDFSFRMSLTKATTVGGMFLLAGLWLLLKRRYALLAILAFGFVWSYGGFLLLGILAGVVISVRAALLIWHTHTFPKQHALKLLFLPAISVGAGMIAGLCIHPSFPDHFHFYWEQIIQIGFINYAEQIGVGGEWYPYSPDDLAGSMIVATLLYAISVFLGVWHAKKLCEGSWVTLIMSVFFLLFTIKSRRYVEYLIPWSILTSAYILTDSGVLHWGVRRIRNTIEDWGTHPLTTRLLISIASIGLVVQTASISYSQIETVHDYLQTGFQTTLFTNAGAWLHAHATPGDIVFHDDWSTFPLLFYQTTKPYYIVGLDPTFMYRHNADLYWKWANITLNRYEGDIYSVIADDFGARFVFVDSKHTALRSTLLLDSRFKKVYEDDEATIFRVPRTQTYSPIQ